MKPARIADEMHEMLTSIFESAGLSLSDAREKASSAWTKIADRLGGNRIYIPRERNENNGRDEAIYAAHVFGKISLREIAKHYGINATKAHRIVTRVGAEVGMKNNLAKR